MRPDMWIGVLHAHSFKSHFSPPFNRYNNRLTVHVYTIARSSMVCFYWGLIHGPVWRRRMLRWAPTCLAKQTASRESPQDCMDIDVTTFCDMCDRKWPELFGHIKIFEWELPTTLWLPTTPYRDILTWFHESYYSGIDQWQRRLLKVRRPINLAHFNCFSITNFWKLSLLEYK